MGWRLVFLSVALFFKSSSSEDTPFATLFLKNKHKNHKTFPPSFSMQLVMMGQGHTPGEQFPQPPYVPALHVSPTQAQFMHRIHPAQGQGTASK
jgi:hypothetical protein